MELNGTLHEYLLADVFQLLAQQKATGRLEVRNGQRVGFMVLQGGLIIFAQQEEENIQQKLSNGLRIFRRAPAKDIEKLLSTTLTQPSRFAAEIVNRKFATAEEVSVTARSTLEDMACELFGWSQGTYKFDSIDTTRQFAIPGVALPADSVVMEAMRRDDEGKRLFGKLSDTTVLVPTGRDSTLGALPKNILELYQSPDAHVLSFIDGLTSVNGIVTQSCLCNYRVKESLIRLQQASLITPLPERLSREIQAAMSRKNAPSISLNSLAIAVSGSVLAAAIVASLGFFVFQRVIMGNKLVKSIQIRTAIEITEARQKAASATLQYYAEIGKRPTTLAQLVESGYLFDSDIAPLISKKQPDISAQSAESPQ